jgi:SAM-dependent methyltransferase
MLDFTGERFLPTEQGELRYEHMHRYAWCLAYCKDRDVLDVACGEGYGSALLASQARAVVGVDISKEAVEHARATYGHIDSVSYICGSATRIPQGDASADVVVSFETIEHLAEQREMLAELKRVLRPDGLLIISSPNKAVYSDDRNYTNEFHIKELYFDELDLLLKEQFAFRSYLGQRFATVSLLAPLDTVADGYAPLTLRSGAATNLTARFAKPMYFVAVCANQPLAGQRFPVSAFVEEGIDLYKDHEAIMKWASGLDRDHKALQQRHLQLQSEFDARSAWALALNAELMQFKK